MQTEYQLEQLINQWEHLVQSDENQKRLKMWDKPVEFRHYWRGIPRKGNIPVVGELSSSSWQKLLGFSFSEFYTKPIIQLIYSLQMFISTFCLLDDDVPLREMPYWLGTIFAQGLFGLKPLYSKTDYPWNNPNPIIHKESDIDDLMCLGFKEKKGIMNLANNYFMTYRKYMKPKFVPNFISWGRGPFGVATHLRGMTSLLVDTLKNPGLVHKLMNKITNERIRWFSAREEFNPESDWIPSILNDEINCPTISPQGYREFVVPYEQKLAKYHQGVYYHSCGDLTKLLPEIRKVEPIKLFHVSPYTDLEKTIEILGTKVALEISFNCTSEILEVDKEKMKEIISKKVELCIKRGVERFFLRTEGFTPYKSLEHSIDKLKQWVRVAKKVVRANTQI